MVNTKNYIKKLTDEEISSVSGGVEGKATSFIIGSVLGIGGTIASLVLLSLPGIALPLMMAMKHSRERNSESINKAKEANLKK